MFLKAEVQIGDSVIIDVIRCNYAFNRDVDSKGRPSSGVYGGSINLIVVSTDDTSIIETMLNHFRPVDGRVTFKKAEDDVVIKTLHWENGYIVRFKEELDITAAKQMLIDFTLSAQKIKMGYAEHSNEWPS